MLKLSISSKNIISVEEFMDVYLGVPYTGKEKLTHKVMASYLYSKSKKPPKRATMALVKKDCILTGRYIFVKDVAGQIIPYMNPRSINLKDLQMQLNSESRKKDLEEIRAKIIEQASNNSCSSNNSLINKEKYLEKKNKKHFKIKCRIKQK